MPVLTSVEDPAWLEPLEERQRDVVYTICHSDVDDLAFPGARAQFRVEFGRGGEGRAARANAATVSSTPVAVDATRGVFAGSSRALAPPEPRI